MKNEFTVKIGLALGKVRRKKPLIHHITNYVTAGDCANITLAIGASPIMADDIGEVEDMVSISSALVLNMGTLTQRTVESMIAAGKKANSLKIPVVFDPVGAGASAYRNRTAFNLLEEVQCSVIRGNISEIGFIAGMGSAAKGVDAAEDDIEKSSEAGSSIARNAAKKLRCVAAVTGPVDVISDGSRAVYIQNGTKLLSGVTGTGCMCTSLIGAYCGVTADYLIAAAGGLLSMGIAGELASQNAGGRGYGSFHIGIIDAIGNLSAEEINRRAKIYEED